MGDGGEGHHRSSWLRQTNKSHKRSHRSNRQVNRLLGGRVGGNGVSVASSSSGKSIAKLSRSERHNQAQLRRKIKRLRLVAQRRMDTSCTTIDSQIGQAPRIVGVISLASHASPHMFAQTLIHEMNPQQTIHQTDLKRLHSQKPVSVHSSRFKCRISVIVGDREAVSVMDIAKVADMLCFVLPVGERMSMETNEAPRAAMDKYLESAVDCLGREFITLVNNQGVGNVVGVIQDLNKVSPKHRTGIKRQATLFFHEEFGQHTKVLQSDAKGSSLQNAIQSCIVNASLKRIAWRSERSYLLSQEVTLKHQEQELVVNGYLRGMPLAIHQLLHITGHGNFQLKRVEYSQDPYAIKSRVKKAANSMQVEITQDHKTQVIEADPSRIPSLKEEATPDMMAGEQTWPTAEEMQNTTDADTNAGAVAQKKEERTSSGRKKADDYQSAWLVDDDESEGSDQEDKDLKDMEDEPEGESSIEMLKEWKQRRMEENDEVMFPDEVEVPLEMSAKQRFAKYRGLKSFRQSPWHPYESLPPEYAYIHQLDDYNLLRNDVLKKGREVQEAWLQHVEADAGSHLTGISSLVFSHNGEDYLCPGSYVRIVLACQDMKEANIIANSQKPTILSSLLEHEQKLTIVNSNVKRVSTYEEPVKSRELLTMHCGFWRRQVRPTFSENSLNCDKHKLDRYLQQGRWSVASVYAPITLGTNVPVMLFDSKNQLVAAGAVLDSNANRIVVKKAVLTGYPLRIKKRKAVIRFMFHRPEDVKWFKPVELWTKYGAVGRIVESVGTHGLYKAIFDRVQKSNDTICISLYKRVFPKPVHEFKSLQIND